MSFLRPSWYRPESERFLNLDALRIVAAYGVVISHIPVFTQVIVPDGFADRVLSSLTTFVDVFFVISGIVIAELYGNQIKSWSQYVEFLRKRVARLVPLHYLTLAFFVALALAAAHSGVAANHPDLYDMSCIPAQLLLAHAWGTCRSITFNGPSWSISAEMGMYLLCPILFYLIGKSRAALLCLIVAPLLACWLLEVDIGRWYDRTYNLGVLRALPAFSLGIWLASIRGDLGASVLRRVPIFLVFAAFVASGALPEAAILLHLVLGYLLVVVVYAHDAASKVSGFARSLAPLGKLTYSIYMLQLPVASIGVSIVFRRIMHLSETQLIFAFLFTSFVVLPIVATVSFLYFETPMRRMLSGSARRPAVHVGAARPSRTLS